MPHLLLSLVLLSNPVNAAPARDLTTAEGALASLAEVYNAAVAAYEPIAKLPVGATPSATQLAASQAAWGKYVDRSDAVLNANPSLRTPLLQFQSGQGAYLAGRHDDAVRRLDALAADPAAAGCRTDADQVCVEQARVLAWWSHRALLVAEIGGDAHTTPGFTMSAEGFPMPVRVEGIESETVGSR
jgi:hypothetical protein